MCGFLIYVVVFWGSGRGGVREKKWNNLRIQNYFELCNREPSENIRQLISLAFKSEFESHQHVIGISYYTAGKIHHLSELERREKPTSN